IDGSRSRYYLGGRGLATRIRRRTSLVAASGARDSSLAKAKEACQPADLQVLQRLAFSEVLSTLRSMLGLFGANPLKRRRSRPNSATAVALLRVSTTRERQALGLQAQREAIAAWAKKAGVRIVAEHVDEASGAAPVDE